MISHRCQIRVRYAETDQMQFAHHSAYIVWFEHARIDLLKAQGFSYARLEKEGYLMPVLEVFARFIRYAQFDDLLTIEVKLAGSGAKFRFEYVVLNEKDETICEGFSLHTFMNTENKATRPPRALLRHLRGV